MLKKQKLRFGNTLITQIGLPVYFLALCLGTAIGILWHSSLTQDTWVATYVVQISLVLIAFFLTVFYSYTLFNRYLLKPLAEVIDLMTKIGTEEYGDKLHVYVQNECAQLADAANVLAKKIEKGNQSDDVTVLKQTIIDLDNGAKLLIQRDLELTRANEKLQMLDKLKSDFVSLATHQLRTPLSGARWSLSMLINGEMGSLTTEQKLFLMKTYESNNRMIALINDMLHADRVDSGTLAFKFTPTNLIYLLENVIAELRVLAELRKVEIVLTASKQIPDLLIDPDNMRIVLQNLIDNAIKYSKNGSKVIVNVTIKKPVVEISVKDQGIGIPKEQQKNIFNRFFRAPNAIHTETDGSGLGLYIVESIVKKHHGTIQFSSEENKGTTFFVTLPIIDKK